MPASLETREMMIALDRWSSLACLLTIALSSLSGSELALTTTPSLRIGLTDHDSERTGGTIGEPEEGLWSIGTGWTDEWPAHWSHGQPVQRRQIGPSIVMTGSVLTPDGTWTIRDTYRPIGDDSVLCKRRWQYEGDQPSGPTVLSIRFQVDRGESEIPLRTFLPGINYFGNPSGTRIDPNRVPTWSAKPGAEGLYEEHRYPLPYASVEQDDGFVAAIHSRPSRLPFGAREDLWWSMGLIENEKGTELTLLSGPVASNGMRGVVKARQTKLLPYRNAFLDKVPPGTVIEKRFLLQLAPNPSRGHGFGVPLWRSIDWFDPIADHSMPRPNDVIRAKLQDTCDRWHEDEQCRGFRTRPPQAQPWFMMGWADRAEVPGHTLLAMNLEGFVDDPALWRQRAADSLDFLVTAPSTDSGDGAGFSIVYDYAEHKWLPRQNPLSQAQTLNAIANAIAVAKNTSDQSLVDPQPWERFLRDRLSRFADHVLDPDWRPVSTNQAFAISPLVKGSELFRDQRYMEAARKIADHTIQRHLSMEEPYWGGTLDAKCEDKEGAWAALQGFAELYRVSSDRRYLDAAVHAADVCLSYLYVWDVDLPPGRLADHALKTRGWTSVSVQNQHLDVFGVVFTPTLWQLGSWTGNDRYHQLARVMFVSCGQMTDLATGIQGEQLFQTNYQQHEAGDFVEGMRGGYSEAWNIYWITAHFLTAAAGLEKLGVDWRAF